MEITYELLTLAKVVVIRHDVEERGERQKQLEKQMVFFKKKVE